jgi:uncharacterized protein YcbK (DUF882 family)
MLRLVVFGVALSLAVAAGPRDANAGEEAEQPGSASAGSGDDGASSESPAPARKKRRGKRSRRPVVTGRVVPEEQLRQEPLSRPSGRVHLIFPGLKDSVDVNIYNADGSYNLDAMEELSHLLRCRRTDAVKPIDPQLLMLLSHVSDHFGGKPLEVVSGYRNQRKTSSNHTKGTATDFKITGVSPRKIREFAESLDGGGLGIGIYPTSGFVHIDVRPPPSYRWVDYSPPNSNAAEKRPPRGWKRKKLQS